MQGTPNKARQDGPEAHQGARAGGFPQTRKAKSNSATKHHGSNQYNAPQVPWAGEVMRWRPTGLGAPEPQIPFTPDEWTTKGKKGRA